MILRLLGFVMLLTVAKPLRTKLGEGSAFDQCKSCQTEGEHRAESQVLKVIITQSFGSPSAIHPYLLSNCYGRGCACSLWRRTTKLIKIIQTVQQSWRLPALLRYTSCRERSVRRCAVADKAQS